MHGKNLIGIGVGLNDSTCLSEAPSSPLTLFKEELPVEVLVAMERKVCYVVEGDLMDVGIVDVGAAWCNFE